MFIEEWYRKALIHFPAALKEEEYSYSQLEEQMKEVPTEKLIEEVKKLKETTPLDRYYFFAGFTHAIFLAHIFTDEELTSGEATEGVIGLEQFRKEFLGD